MLNVSNSIDLFQNIIQEVELDTWKRKSSLKARDWLLGNKELLELFWIPSLYFVFEIENSKQMIESLVFIAGISMNEKITCKVRLKSELFTVYML